MALLADRPAHVLDEDLLERRIGDLIAGHAYATRERRPEDHLRVSLPVDVELGEILAWPNDPHAGDGRQPAHAAVTADGQPDTSTTGRSSHVCEPAADDDPATVHDRDRVAELFDGVHLVRAEDERLAPVAH